MAGKTKTERMVRDAKLHNMLRKAAPGQTFTQEQIAEQMGVSRQAVQQTEARALRKLVRGCGPILPEFLDGLHERE